MDFSLSSRSWWNNLDADVKELLLTSEALEKVVSSWQVPLKDYSFVVFPAAKAYEGFLKKSFLELGFINENDYHGKFFRVGKALNPALEKRYRDESVYDKIVHHCSGSVLADKLWETWKEARNVTFHWFPGQKNAITFEEAQNKVKMVLEAMDEFFVGCKIS